MRTWGKIETDVTDLVESSIGKEIRKSGEITKSQLLKMMIWRAEYLNLRNRNLGFIEKIDENALMYITKMVLQMPEEMDLYKIKILCSFNGVGPTGASVILGFYNPLRYGIFTWRVWRELFINEKILRSPENYVRFLKKLRKRANDTGEKVRDIEFTLWKRNKKF